MPHIQLNKLYLYPEAKEIKETVSYVWPLKWFDVSGWRGSRIDCQSNAARYR